MSLKWTRRCDACARDIQTGGDYIALEGSLIEGGYAYIAAGSSDPRNFCNRQCLLFAMDKAATK